MVVAIKGGKDEDTVATIQTFPNERDAISQGYQPIKHESNIKCWGYLSSIDEWRVFANRLDAEYCGATSIHDIEQDDTFEEMVASLPDDE